MSIKGQNSKENLVAKESYYVDKNILSAFEDIKKDVAKEATEDNKMDRVAIEVDYAWNQEEESLEEALKDSFDGYDVDYKVIMENGPAGGWPVIRVEGDRGVLTDWINERYGVDPEDDWESWIDFKDIEKEPIKKDERESEVPDATEACACEDDSGDEMARLFLSLDEAETDEEISNVAEMAENSLANGDINMEEYNTFISELNNKK